MAKRRSNGEGNIRKRKDGRWEGRYTAGYDPETGKQVFKNVLRKTQTEVKEKLKKALEENQKIDFTKAGKYTVSQWMEEWFENVCKIKVRPSSHQTYRGYIDNHITPEIEKKETQTIPAEQLQAFLAEAKATGVYEMYYIELATGLRRGELLGLKWQDVDLENQIITVRRQIARINGEITEAPLKTKNSYRTVTISPQAVEVLKAQKAKTNSEYVFPSPTGGPISPDSVNNMLKHVLKRSGIPKVRFHDLRHTFATLALQNGVDIKTVSGMLGHFSAGFTLDTYAHVTTAAQRDASETMGNILAL